MLVWLKIYCSIRLKFYLAFGQDNDNSSDVDKGLAKKFGQSSKSGVKVENVENHAIRNEVIAWRRRSIQIQLLQQAFPIFIHLNEVIAWRSIHKQLLHPINSINRNIATNVTK